MGHTRISCQRTAWIDDDIKMLERDIKTMYDLDLELDTTDNLDETNWEKRSSFKRESKRVGILGNLEASFYSKQAKLQPFVPPPKFSDTFGSTSFVLVDTAEIEKNIEKIARFRSTWNQNWHFKSRNCLRKIILNELIDLELFFFKYSRFLNENQAELKEIETTKNHEKWLHFFDVYDDDDVP